MSELDQKQIDCLYTLLREKEKSDPDTAASLRWAIFQLEQMDRQNQEGADLMMKFATRSQHKINEIMDTGCSTRSSRAI